MRELDQAAGTLDIAKQRPASDKMPASDGKPRGKRTNNSGRSSRPARVASRRKAHRNLRPAPGELVAAGKVKRHDFDEACKLGHRRASKVRSASLAVLRQRRPRPKHGRSLLAGGIGSVASARPRGVLALRYPACAAVARRPHDRAGAAVLGSHSCATGPQQHAAELGPIDVPVEPLDLAPASEQQAAAS